MMPQTIEVKARPGGRRITLTGTLDSGNAQNLDALLSRLTATDRCVVELDLANCDYVSSAGWSLFVTARHRVTARGGDLVLRNVHPMLRAMAAHLKAEPLLSFA